MGISGRDLNLLVPLRALLEEANVTRAAERLGVGQSAMSSALSRLRQQYGDELLVRVGRGYDLTPLARLLLPQVQATVPLVEGVLGSEGPFAPAKARRRYTIRSSDYAAVELKPLLDEALQKAPGISVDLLPLPPQPTASEHDLLASDFIAAVPGIGIEGNNALLFTDVYVCLLDKGNPAITSGKLSWDEFRSLPQAMPDFGKAHQTPAARRLWELGVPPQAHVTTNGFLPLPQAVAGTNLVAIVPSRLAQRLGEATGTVAVPAPFGEVEIIETLWWHPSHESDPSHVWLREQLTSSSGK